MNQPLLKNIGADGLPVMTDDEREAGYAKGLKMIGVILLVPRLICLGCNKIGDGETPSLDTDLFL